MKKLKKFQEYTSINQHYCDQGLTAIERSASEDNESLEDDVQSFVDKTSHLTTAVLRSGVEKNILSIPYLPRPQ